MNARLKIFSGNSHPGLARAICDAIDVPLGQYEVVRFKNDNLMVKIGENVRECDVFYIQTSVDPVNDNVMEALIAIDALKSASAARVTAVLPYFPYARSDKKDRPRISITARLIADLLQTAGADRVLTMDLHSPQIQGFFRVPVDQLIAAPIICKHLESRDLENTVLVAGDAGEAKELGRFANRLHLPMAVVDKRRFGDDDRAVATNLIGDVKGMHALIVDDEIATGGTICEAARFLMDKGALSCSVAATHGVLAGPAIERINNSVFENVVVTDTIPMGNKRSDKIHVISVASLFARAIRRIHDGDSVSDLF
jgi:ribose-phosphate pyrophosphokinase